MNFFSVDKIRANRTARAIGDIRHGVPIIASKKYLIISVETLLEYDFNELKQSFKDKLTVVLPRPPANQEFLSGDAFDLCFKQIKDLCDPITRKLSSLAFIESENEITLFKSIRELLVLAKLLPIFLFVELTLTDEKRLDEASILNIEEQDLTSYKKLANSSVEQIIDNVPIHLNYSSKAALSMFRATLTGEEHCAIVIGDINASSNPIIRIHSACYTGDLLQSLQCDCNAQLIAAIQLMNEKPENAGIILYMAQEGRGIGLANKLRAYALQKQGCDTVEANEQLGFEMDERDYSIAIEILKKLKITRMRLLTNNPEKAIALTKSGIIVSKILPLRTKVNRYNEKYMETKKKRMAHAL